MPSRSRSATLSHPYRSRPASLGTTFTAPRANLRRSKSGPYSALYNRQIYLSNCSIFLPPSLAPLDLPIPSTTLPDLRERLLETLQEVETSLVGAGQHSEPVTHSKLEEAMRFIWEGFELLERLKGEFGAHFFSEWEFELPDVRSSLPEISDVRAKLPDLPDVRSRLPDLPAVTSKLPELPGTVRSKLSELDNIFDFELPATVSSHFLPDFDFSWESMGLEFMEKLSHLDLHGPSIPFPDIGDSPQLTYIRLKLATLRDHILKLEFPSTSLGPSVPSKRFLEDLLLVEDEKPVIISEVEKAIELSAGGAKLIEYEDLPAKWKNNEFVKTGYRFIPFSSWPSLALSVFKLHNETLHIHTHLLPLMLIVAIWLPTQPLTSFIHSHLSSIPFLGHTLQTSLASIAPSSLSFADQSPFLATLFNTAPEVEALPRYMFWVAAAMCLACSTVWHISAGCADVWVLEAGARIDYVGIGWLISASVATAVYYGFRCDPTILKVYTVMTLLTGLAGSIAPFQSWFDERRNKGRRIAFFLVLAGASVLPLAHMTYLAGFWKAYKFIAPVIPSIVSYLAGLVFYATHFPECMFPGRFDWGGGSHAIWHVFIVIAIRLHWTAIQVLQQRTEGATCAFAL